MIEWVDVTGLVLGQPSHVTIITQETVVMRTENGNLMEIGVEMNLHADMVIKFKSVIIAIVFF